jgi:hypothetical protein
LGSEHGHSRLATMNDIADWAATILGSRRFIWSVVAFGIALRVVQYAANRSLWGDEGALALNISIKPLSEILRPLDFLQGAPSGYLLAQEGVTALLGDSESALRLVALVSGIAALVLFAVVARRLLEAPAAGLAVVLVAVSEPLIYYSSEVKQYSTDTAVATLLLLGATVVDWRRARPAQLVIVMVLGSTLVWFSHTALIMLPSLILALLIARRLEGDTQGFRRILASACVIGLSSVLAYAVGRRNTSAVGEAALGPGGGADGILSPLTNLWDAFADPVGVAYSTTGLAVAAAALGVYVVARRSLEAALLIVTPIAATLTAAMLGLYPFTGRFVLFLVPAATLLLGAGLWAIVDFVGDRGRLFAVVAIALVLGYPAATALRNMISPPGHEEVRTVLRHLESNWRPGDALYVWFQSQFPFRYYAQCDDCDVLGPEGPASIVWPPNPRDLPNHDAIETHAPEFYVSGRPRDLGEYVRDLKRLRGKPRVWLLYSSNWNDEFVQYALDCLGVRLDEVRAKRAVAYLYDFTEPPQTPTGECA